MLVDAGHCASCHSPLNAIGGEQRGAHSTAASSTAGKRRRSIRSAAARPWTQAQLVTYLRTGRASEHGAAAGPMLPVTRDLATVPAEDVEAIAAYILSIQKPANGRDAAAANPAERAATTPPRSGAVLFQASCAQCHGPAAPMQSIGERPTLSFSTAVNADTPRNAIQMMFNGIGWHGEDTLNYMPSFVDQYDDAQIADLAAYVRATYTDRPAWSGVDALAAKLRKEDTPMITLTVNGVRHTLDIDPSTPLLYALRNDLHLHGAKFGCGLGQCGACTVIVDGKPTFSCLMPVAAVGTRSVRTIESLGTAEHPPLQRAFVEHQAAQCGYCIAGMIMRAQALLERNPKPTEQELRTHMEPNLCRCGTCGSSRPCARSPGCRPGTRLRPVTISKGL